MPRACVRSVEGRSGGYWFGPPAFSFAGFESVDVDDRVAFDAFSALALPAPLPPSFPPLDAAGAVALDWLEPEVVGPLDDVFGSVDDFGAFCRLAPATRLPAAAVAGFAGRLFFLVLVAWLMPDLRAVELLP